MTITNKYYSPLNREPICSPFMKNMGLKKKKHSSPIKIHNDFKITLEEKIWGKKLIGTQYHSKTMIEYPFLFFFYFLFYFYASNDRILIFSITLYAISTLYDPLC